MSNFIARIRRWLGLAPKKRPALEAEIYVIEWGAELDEDFWRGQLAQADRMLQSAAEEFARVVLEALDG